MIFGMIIGYLFLSAIFAVIVLCCHFDNNHYVDTKNIIEAFGFYIFLTFLWPIIGLYQIYQKIKNGEL